MEYTMVQVHIKEIEDTTPALDYGDKMKKLIHGQLQDFNVLEKGTSGGNASVAFCALAEDGTGIVLETTGAIFETMYAAYTGAKKRFEEKKASKN